MSALTRCANANFKERDCKRIHVSASDEQSGVSELIGFLKKVLPMISLWIVCEDGTTYEQSASTWVPPAQSANDQSPTDPPLPSEVSGEPIGYGTFRLTGHEEPEEAPAQSTPEEIDPNAEETSPKDKEEDLDPKQRRTTFITEEELNSLLGNDLGDGEEDTRRPDSAEPEDPEE